MKENAQELNFLFKNGKKYVRILYNTMNFLEDILWLRL